MITVNCPKVIRKELWYSNWLYEKTERTKDLANHQRETRRTNDVLLLSGRQSVFRSGLLRRGIDPIKNERATSTIGWSSETELADEYWAMIKTALEAAIKQK